MLIALAVRLAKDKNLFHLVKSHPESLEEFKPKFVKMMEDDLKSEDEEEEEEEEQEEQKPVDEWQVAPEPKRNLRKQQHLIEKAQKLIQSQADQQPVAEEAKVPDQTLEKEKEEGEGERKADVEAEGDAEKDSDEASDDTIDDEAEGGEWITMDNIEKHLTTQSQATESHTAKV